MNHTAFFVANNSSSWCPYDHGEYGDLIDQHSSDYNNRKLVLWRPDYRQEYAYSTNINNTRVYAFELNV